MSPVGATESKYFNPRSPHGERPRPSVPHISTIEFQSTLPARGATHRRWAMRSTAAAFQSTLPARGATELLPDKTNVEEFQSTLPARGATEI